MNIHTSIGLLKKDYIIILIHYSNRLTCAPLFPKTDSFSAQTHIVNMVNSFVSNIPSLHQCADSSICFAHQ